MKESYIIIIIYNHNKCYFDNPSFERQELKELTISNIEKILDSNIIEEKLKKNTIHL